MKNTEFSFSVKITFVLILKSNILIERCPFQSQLSSGILLHTIFKSAFHTLQVGVFIFSLRQAVNKWRYHCLLQQQKNIVYHDFNPFTKNFIEEVSVLIEDGKHERCSKDSTRIGQSHVPSDFRVVLEKADELLEKYGLQEAE